MSDLTQIETLQKACREICQHLNPNMITLEGDPQFFAYNAAALAVGEKTFTLEEWFKIKNDIAQKIDLDNI